MFGRLATALLALFLVAQPLTASPAPASPPAVGARASSLSGPGPVPPGLGTAGPSATESTEDWYTVAGSGFIPEDSDLTWNYDVSAADGCMSPTSAGTWRASINLPPGSTMEGVNFGYHNTSSSKTSTAYIQVFSATDLGTTTVPVTIDSSPGSSGTGYNYTYGAISPAVVVDNYLNAYVFKWNVAQAGGGGQDLCWMQVGYVPPPVFGNFLPAVNK